MQSGKRKWLILTVIVIKMIIDGLDLSMLNIALPVIRTSLSVTSGAVVWAVSAYTITVSATVLFFGRLGDMIGKAKFYKIGLAIYTMSTLFGGIVNSFPLLVAARIVQALGASCTMANSQGIIVTAFPQEQRGRAIGIYGGAMSIGALAGPTVGGFIVANMHWQYIFLLNVPIAVIALVLGLRFFPKDIPVEKEKLDYPGVFIYALAVIPLLYSLQVGFAAGYGSIQFLSGIAVSIIALTFFIITQRRKTAPLLDLSIFRNPLYSVGVFSASVLFLSNMFRNIIIPFYMQGALGMPPDRAGLYMSISPIVLLLVTPLSGFLTDRFNGEHLTIIGQVFNLAGTLLISTLKKSSNVIMLVVYLCIASFGTALFQAPNNTLIISSLPMNKLGIGGASSMAIRNIGMALGIALATAVLYGSMSNFLGYPVTDYISGIGQDDAFIFGMRNAFCAAAVFCLFGIIASIVSAKKHGGGALKTREF